MKKVSKKDVKEFVREHKREILLGAVCIGTGIVIGKRNTVVRTNKVRTEHRFNGINEAVDYLMKGSEGQEVFWNDEDGTVGDIAGLLKSIYANRPGGLKTRCNGFIVFTK